MLAEAKHRMTIELTGRDMEVLEDVKRRLEATSNVEVIRRSIRFLQALDALRDGGNSEVWVHRPNDEPVQVILIY
jgi:hypothetical protein